jgi:hypothetical protein
MSAARENVDKINAILSLINYGAVGNGVTNDLAAFKAIETKTDESGGGELVIGPKSYAIGQDGSNPWCFAISNPLSLRGQGSIISAIRPLSSVSASADVIRIEPGQFDATGYLRLQNLFVGDNGAGTRYGGIGINFVLTGANRNLDRHLMDGVFVQAASSNATALQILNAGTSNVNGAYFLSEIRRSAFNGGIKMVEVGDSLLLQSVTTTGQNIGVDFSGVNAGGGQPSQFILFNYNSTSVGGAVLHRGGLFFALMNSNIEQTYDNTGGRMVDVGRDDTTYSPLIWSNYLGVYSGANLADTVRISNSTGGIIANNVFAIASATTSSTTDIVISSTSKEVWVGPNVTGRAAGLIITDNGVGTRGVTKTPALQNGWVDFGSGANVVQYVKSVDGMVHIWGCCKNGTTTGGTLLFTLADRFRPAGFIRSTVAVDDGGSYAVPGLITILSNGQVLISYVPTSGGAAAQTIFFNISFRVELGNSIFP